MGNDRDASDYRPDIDPDATAVIMNGALDAIVSKNLTAPDFDTARAAEYLIDLLRRSCTSLSRGPSGRGAD
ncbi:hypothetical protein ABT008_26665 [Micromonospora sp. NPDC002389]|uniref:hypothetical protein n=1 Tax=Micromonospora sp. NPDC002389 TaxID=3154272 RepID=UPI0033232D9E